MTCSNGFNGKGCEATVSEMKILTIIILVTLIIIMIMMIMMMIILLYIHCS